MPTLDFQAFVASLVAGADRGLLLPMAASVGLVVQSVRRAGRRRAVLNEAVHEVRRPLQAIALAASGPRAPEPSLLRGSVDLAADALERLDREINGVPGAALLRATRVEPLVRAAVRRWQTRAALAGASLEMRWQAGAVALAGDAPALSQALDNLIVNAIEHGGPSIAVQGRLNGNRLRLAVVDAGRPAAVEKRRRIAGGRLSGRRRHGHGLAVVRRIAAAHGGRFSLRRAASGSEAALELPLAAGGTR